MELQFEKKPIQCLQRTAWEVQEQEQTQEVRLSDEMPDIGTIIAAWGQCVLRGKEWRTDHVGATGGVMARVLYIGADGSKMQVVECWLPMQMKWNIPPSQQEGIARTMWTLKNVDARMLSARKMMIRANAQALLETMVPQQNELYQMPQVPEDVQLLCKKYPVDLPAEAGEKAFSVEDELQTGMQPKPEQLVGMELNVQINEQNVIGGKAVFRGDVVAHSTYMGEDGMAHSIHSRLPFSQFADLDRDYDKNATLSVMCAVTNMETEIADGKLILKAGIVAQYLVYDQMLVETVADAYSPWRPVDCDRVQLSLPLELERKTHTEKVELAFDAKPGRLVDAWVRPGQPAVRHCGDVAQVENRGDISLLYYDEGGILRCDTKRYSLAQDIPTDEGVRVLAGVGHAPVDVQLSDEIDGVNAEAAITWQSVAVADSGLEVVSALDMGEKQPLDDSRPSLVLQRAEGNSLWELAKKNGSTMSAIMQANALPDEPMPGQMLLIPVV